MSQDKPKGPPPSADSAPRQPDRVPPPAGDARGDAARQRQNREHLRVDEDHQTPEMKKGHRGTFP